MSKVEYATGRDEGIVVLTHEPARCYICGEPHFMFVNRKGRTHCTDCDDRFATAEAAMRRQAAGLEGSGIPGMASAEAGAKGRN